MTETDKLYYKQMLSKERLIPFFEKDRLVCFVTFYICDDENKYMEADPFKVLDDLETGKCCYVAQVITDKHKDNKKLSYMVFHRFREYIRKTFPTVQYIVGRRWNKENNIVKTYKKEM